MHEPPDFSRLGELLHLEPHGADVYVGLSPTYPWGRVYGGQVVAQALKAAVLTVDPTFSPHSLHAYFIRGGTSDEPIRYEVDRIRNGRSFVTRRVVARQSNGAILNLSASFQVVEGDVDVQAVEMPAGVPGPDDLDDEHWTPLMQRRTVPRDVLGGRHGVWIRVNGPIDDEQSVSVLSLAYASDDVPYDAAAAAHPEYTGEWDGQGEAPFMGASLDHALWFHRDAPPDAWYLHVLDGLGHTGNRGLAFGQVFTADGRHVASVAQEILHRQNTRS